jgi:hypothetical protein
VEECERVESREGRLRELFGEGYELVSMYKRVEVGRFEELVRMGWFRSLEESREVWLVRKEKKVKGKVGYEWGVVAFTLKGTSMGSNLSWVILNICTRAVCEVLYGDRVNSCQCGDDLVVEGEMEPVRAGFAVIGAVVNDKSVSSSEYVEFCGERGEISNGSVSWDVGLRLGGLIRPKKGVSWVRDVKGESVSEGSWKVEGDVKRFVDGVKAGVESIVKEVEYSRRRVLLDQYWQECRKEGKELFSRLVKVFRGWWLLGVVGEVPLRKNELVDVKKELRLWEKVALGGIAHAEFVGLRLRLLEESEVKGAKPGWNKFVRRIVRGLVMSLRKKVRAVKVGEWSELDVKWLGSEEDAVRSYVCSDPQMSGYWNECAIAVRDVMMCVLVGRVGREEMVIGDGDVVRREEMVKRIVRQGGKDSEGLHEVQWSIRKMLKECMLLRYGEEFVEALFGDEEMKKSKKFCRVETLSKRLMEARVEAEKDFSLYLNRYPKVGKVYSKVLRYGGRFEERVGRVMSKVESERVVLEYGVDGDEYECVVVGGCLVRAVVGLASPAVERPDYLRGFENIVPFELDDCFSDENAVDSLSGDLGMPFDQIE